MGSIAETQGGVKKRHLRTLHALMLLPFLSQDIAFSMNTPNMFL